MARFSDTTANPLVLQISTLGEIAATNNSYGGVRGIKFGIDVGSVNEDSSPRLLWKQRGNLNKYKSSFTKLQTELGINYDPKRDDSEIKRLNNFLESVDNNQVNQQLISTIFPKKAQNLVLLLQQIFI